tara:strand:+ start:10295 stop:10669 length:375 start_codon:yes stop_codon:yes gene_type:complete
MKKQKQSIKLNGQKISLNFIDVDITVVKPDFPNANMCEEYGQYHRRKNLIEIQENLSDIDESNTVIHELMHLIAYASGEVTAGALTDETVEERIVNSFANLLISMLRQNPWLLHYLQDKLSHND